MTPTKPKEAPNPFEQQEWTTQSVGTILPPGDHIVTIDSIDGSGTTSGGYPQLEVKAHNDRGTITDWLAVIDAALFRTTSLFVACGLDKPTKDQVAREGENGYRIDPKYLEQCVDKEVGVVVREEPDRNDPTRTRTKVKGWVLADELNPTDLPADTSGLPETGGVPGTAADDDIPF